MMSQPVIASSFASGPTGPSVNGIFTGKFIVNFNFAYTGSGQYLSAGNNYYGGQEEYSCNLSPGQCSIFGYQGTHHYKVWQNASGDLYYDLDDKCGNNCGQIAGSASDAPGVAQVLFDQVIVIDETPPVVSITSPTNNANTSAPAISVTGIVSDGNESGVASVKVNGVNATISGSGFSATVPLTTGLNTVTVLASDKAGHQSSTQITVLRQAGSSVSGGSTSGTNKLTETQSPIKQVPVAQGDVSAANSATPQAVVVSKSKKNILVQAATYGGLALAGSLLLTFLILVILFVLNRFSIIKVEFPNNVSPNNREKQLPPRSK